MHPPKSKVCAIELFYFRHLSCFLCHCSHSNLTLGSDISCKELTQNSQTYEKQNRENTCQRKKKKNHTYKTVFTWFSNLLTSTELQGFHYYQGKIKSAVVQFFSLSKTTYWKTLKTTQHYSGRVWSLTGSNTTKLHKAQQWLNHF